MKTYDRVFTHVDKSRQDCIQRVKDHSWRINNEQIFNFIEMSVAMYNKAWNKYTKRIVR